MNIPPHIAVFEDVLEPTFDRITQHQITADNWTQVLTVHDRMLRLALDQKFAATGSVSTDRFEEFSVDYTMLTGCSMNISCTSASHQRWLENNTPEKLQESILRSFPQASVRWIQFYLTPTFEHYSAFVTHYRFIRKQCLTIQRRVRFESRTSLRRR